ncbi:hypothetical protein OF83DRAFT_1083385 [Amylostereum chailletii]|nr:hypothetical protein OF83DRAFT_1083385 [Amylostereum chailletii]
MDLRYEYTSPVRVLEACHNPDACDLIALGGDNSVDVVQIGPNACSLLASFHLGTRVTAIAWSSRSLSPATSEPVLLELAAATADFGLHLLTKSGSSDPVTFAFGGGLSGHHAPVTAMAFCGGPSSPSVSSVAPSTSAPTDRYVATVSDDKMLMVWDLYPALDIPSVLASASPTTSATPMSFSTDYTRPQPTAYATPFPHPLTAVTAHPSSAKDLLVADARGAIYLVDWRSEVADADIGARRHVIELVEPRALADGAAPGGSIAWARDNADLIGAAYGSRFVLWDISKLQGGKPALTGPSFPDGARRFRFSSSPSPHFALIPSRSVGAALHIHATAFPHAPPAVLALGGRPLRVGDFDFLTEPGGIGARGPRVAAGVGRSVIVFWVGEE